MNYNNIIEMVKNQLGPPILISLAGSRSFKIEKDLSDYDFSCYLDIKKNKEGKTEHIENNNFDFFYLSKDYLNDIRFCSSIFFLRDINNIIYCNTTTLLEFINNNKKDLMNINPHATYQLCLSMIEHDKKWNLQYRQIQFAEILKNFYYYGDFSKSLELSEETKKLYRELKDRKKVLSESELNQYLEVLYTPSFKNYFYTFEPNIKLHQEFVKVLNEGGELNGVT